MFEILTCGQIVEYIAKLLSNEPLKITFSGNHCIIDFNKGKERLLRINLHNFWNLYVVVEANEKIDKETIIKLHRIAEELKAVREKFHWTRDLDRMGVSWSFSSISRQEKIEFQNILEREGLANYEQFRGFCQTEF